MVLCKSGIAFAVTRNKLLLRPHARADDSRFVNSTPADPFQQAADLLMVVQTDRHAAVWPAQHYYEAI